MSFWEQCPTWNQVVVEQNISLDKKQMMEEKLVQMTKFDQEKFTFLAIVGITQSGKSLMSRSILNIFEQRDVIILEESILSLFDRVLEAKSCNLSSRFKMIFFQGVISKQLVEMSKTGKLTLTLENNPRSNRLFNKLHAAGNIDGLQIQSNGTTIVANLTLPKRCLLVGNEMPPELFDQTVCFSKRTLINENDHTIRDKLIQEFCDFSLSFEQLFI
jgi:ABC-type oligopeptide transport system ATPase subunit